MAELYDANDTIITSHIASVIPGYDTIKVINRLLSGQYHIQTIGAPARVCRIELTVAAAEKEIIDIAEAINEPVKVVGSKYYIGTIREAPQWNRLAPDKYRTSLVLLVSDEGDLP